MSCANCSNGDIRRIPDIVEGVCSVCGAGEKQWLQAEKERRLQAVNEASERQMAEEEARRRREEERQERQEREAERREREQESRRLQNLKFREKKYYLH